MISEKEDETLQFWDKKNTFLVTLSLGIPISLILINLTDYSIGFNLGNSIALLTAGLAITGTLYSNHQNNIRNQKQINASEKRLEKQLQNQKENLDTQIKSAQQNLKYQLDHNERQLKKQLVFDKQMKVMLYLYELFIKHGRAIDLEKTQTKSETKITAQFLLCKKLKIITNQVKNFYYLPKNIQKKIEEMVQYLQEKENNLDTHPQITEKYLKEIFELLKKDLE